MAINFGGPIVKDKVFVRHQPPNECQQLDGHCPRNRQPSCRHARLGRMAFGIPLVRSPTVLMTRIGFGYKDSQTQPTSRIQIAVFIHCPVETMVATRWLAGILGAHLDPNPQVHH